MTAIIIALAVIILDQLSKFLVHQHMALGQSFNVIPGLIDFTYIRNDGAAWGMLDDKRWVFLLLSTVAIAAIVFVLVKYKNIHTFMKTSLALVLGGGIGNMIDRIFYTKELLEGKCTLFGTGYKLFDGEVIDFIEAAFIDFPIFNIADCGVTIGTVMLFVYIIFIDSKVEKKKALLAAETEEKTSETEATNIDKDVVEAQKESSEVPAVNEEEQETSSDKAEEAEQQKECDDSLPTEGEKIE